MAGILDMLASLFRSSTINKQVPTVNFPTVGAITPSGLPGGVEGLRGDPLLIAPPPEQTTRTISTRRPPAALTFLADFLAGLGGPGAAGPGIRARIGAQQADLDRQMENIERQRKLAEQEFERSKPQFKVNSDGSVVMIRPDRLQAGDISGGVKIFGKKEADPIKFEEALADVQSKYNIEFSPQDRARAYVQYQAYISKKPDERDPSKFFSELDAIISEGQKRKLTETEFDESFDTARGALESLGPFDKEEQAQVDLAISNAQLKKTIQPLQTTAMQLSNKRLAAQIRAGKETDSKETKDEIEDFADAVETGQIEITAVPIKLRGQVNSFIQRRGGTIVSAKKREQIEAFASAKAVINDIESVSKKVNTASRGISLLRGAQRRAAVALQLDNDAALLQSKEGELALLIRAMGEKGTLAEGDVNRAIKLIPSVFDNFELATRKISSLRKLIEDIEKSRVGAAKKTFKKSEKGVLDEGASRLE